MWSKHDIDGFIYKQKILTRKNFQICGYQTGCLDGKVIITLVFSWEEKNIKKQETISFDSDYLPELNDLLFHQMRYLRYTLPFNWWSFIKMWFKSVFNRKVRNE